MALDGEAFGETAPTQAIPAGAYPVLVNLRNPGQYFDQETNLFYNHARYYNPQTGRYITSDPIGLLGGVNTYAYVGGNPSRFKDRSGACLEDFCIAEITVGVGVVQGLAQGVTSWLEGDSFLEGFESGFIGGATSGAMFVVAEPETLLGEAASVLFDFSLDAGLGMSDVASALGGGSENTSSQTSSSQAGSTSSGDTSSCP